jgi:hypothetical protein
LQSVGLIDLTREDLASLKVWKYLKAEKREKALDGGDRVILVCWHCQLCWPIITLPCLSMAWKTIRQLTGSWRIGINNRDSTFLIVVCSTDPSLTAIQNLHLCERSRLTNFELSLIEVQFFHLLFVLCISSFRLSVSVASSRFSFSLSKTILHFFVFRFFHFFIFFIFRPFVLSGQLSTGLL